MNNNIYILHVDENQEEELGILRAELTRSNDFYSKMEEECDSLKRELHNRQVTIEELEEELEASKKKIEVVIVHLYNIIF